MGNSIAFVDWRVADIDSLIAGMPSGTEVDIIDGASDGLDQIAAFLQGRSGIDAIHIISHGSSGSVSLGSSAIDAAALATHTSQLEAIGQALTDNGDILLYGCNVAAGDVGVQFIGSLAKATGADVAASMDLTGALAEGGNWNLEATAGEIQAKALSISDSSFAGVLPAVDLRLNTAGITAGNSAAEIVAIARANIGHDWSDDGCAAFVWGVTNLAGLPFFDRTAHLVGGGTGDPIDINDQDAYAVPHTAGVGVGIGPNASGDGWDLVSSSNSVVELKNLLRAGDVVRVYKYGNSTEDSTTNPWEGVRIFV